MRMVDLIQKKRDGFTLNKEEINYIIQGFTQGQIPDYQMSALAMAIFFQGMNHQEISDLTMAMVHSGDVNDLHGIEGIKVDKHSTGGVGDKVSLIVAPLVATVGIPVAKMSGRGLGHTGGTVDKLESIRGFKIELTREEFIKTVNEVKMSIIGQTGNLVPADKKLYALRDVTATVNSIPLIASSIMSKKIASGADAIVLDVKVGSGAFMKSVEEARELARTMVEIGKLVGRETIAIISNMEEPLGFEIGNANEVYEAIEVLSGRGEKRLTELCLTIASYMTLAAKVYQDFNEAYQALSNMIEKGSALETFKKFVKAQGGDPSLIDAPELLPRAKYSISIKSDKKGFVHHIDAESIGIAAMLLGAGRKTKEDTIDYSVGVTLKKKVGDSVEPGETIAILHSNLEVQNEAHAKILSAYKIGSKLDTTEPIVYEIIK